jgi:hypothetical protein
VHESLPGKRLHHVPQDGLITGYPRNVGRIDLLGDRLVIIGDGDVLLGHLLDAGEEAIELCGADSRQHLRSP